MYLDSFFNIYEIMFNEHKQTNKHVLFVKYVFLKTIMGVFVC